MSKYITEDVMPAAKLKDIIKRSYGTFRRRATTRSRRATTRTASTAA